ncbi:MAG TPA: ABC transporter permease [Thermoplasmata archaeon]|nr:ABC transporter permease [Thermoplasmata archaeon]
MSFTNYVSEVNGIFGRWIKKTLRRPQFLFFSLVQPVVWFVLFTQAFQSIASVPGFSQVAKTSSYVTFFSAAVIIQTVISSAMQSGMGMVTDLESGYMDKMRVAPIHRSAILMGKVLSDGTRIVIQTIVILILGFLLGVTIASGIGGLLILLALAMAFGIAWSGISTFIGLATKNSEATLMISLLTTFPLLFLSTAMMPKVFLPSWVQTVATYNPMSYIADALHALVITGFDWTLLSYAALTILAVGALSLTATTSMFRRTVSG